MAERLRVNKGDSSAVRSSLRRLGKTADDDGWESEDGGGREPTKPRRAFIGAGRMDKTEDVDEVGAGNEAAVTPSRSLISPLRDSCIWPGSNPGNPSPSGLAGHIKSTEEPVIHNTQRPSY